MHNPLALLTTELLDSLIASGHRFFVRQSYPRGKQPLDNKTKEALLITAYTDFSEVNAHFQAVKLDSRKYVYDIQLAGEKEKLYRAASLPEGYKVFVALLAVKKWKPPILLAPKLKNYLRVYTKWKPERGQDTLVSLYIQFGELFLKLRYGTEEIKVPLSEIEKL